MCFGLLFFFFISSNMGADILHCIYTVEMFEISQMNSFWIYTAGSFGQNVVQESGKKKGGK